MQSFHKGFFFASVLVFLVGLGLLLGAKPAAGGPPVFIDKPRQKTQTVAQDPSPILVVLSEPWFRMPIVAVAPPPKPVAAPLRIDTTSVTLLGSSKDSNGEPSYFFKYAPSGQVIILKVGESKKGWTLKAVVDQKFTLVGPGGQFEATH